MLNVPIVHKEIIDSVPKLLLLEEIEYRQKIVPRYWNNKSLVETIINKNEKDGRFTIIINNFPFKIKSFTISLNNTVAYTSDVINSKPGSRIIFTSSMLKDKLIKDVKSISIVSNAHVYQNKYTILGFGYPKWNNIGELLIKLTKNEPTNKSFLIDEKGLEIDSYSSISFRQNKFGVRVNTKKSTIKILPKKLLTGKHNLNMFTIHNVSGTVLPLIFANTIDGLKISGTIKKTRAVFNLNKEKKPEYMLDKNIGSISFDENTFYDFEENKTHIGIGVNSKKGYIIPYKFKGDLIPILSLNVASVSNILIGFSNPIKHAYFDKFSGTVKLEIIESAHLFDDNYIDQNIISNYNFPNLISGNLTLDDIINLGKNVK